MVQCALLLQSCLFSSWSALSHSPHTEAASTAFTNSWHSPPCSRAAGVNAQAWANTDVCTHGLQDKHQSKHTHLFTTTSTCKNSHFASQTHFSPFMKNKDLKLNIVCLAQGLLKLFPYLKFFPHFPCCNHNLQWILLGCYELERHKYIKRICMGLKLFWKWKSEICDWITAHFHLNPFSLYFVN